jgi:hypothetical protein
VWDERFDEQMERGFVRFLRRYDADELRTIVRVLQDSLEVSFLDLGAPQESLENQHEP